MRRFRWFLPLPLVLILGLVLGYRWFTPKLLEVIPTDGEAAISPGSTIRLVFSRPMDVNSIAESLTINPSRTGSFSQLGNEIIFEPDEPWSAGETVRLQLSPGGRAATWPALHQRQAKTWSFKIRQPRLAYLYPAEGPANLYTIDPQTGEIQGLIVRSEGILDYAINANGSSIYFSTKNDQGGSDIYRIDVNEMQLPPTQDDSAPTGSFSQTLIFTCPDATCRTPIVSPQEDYLAFERTAHSAASEPDYPQVWYLPLQTINQTGSTSKPIPVLAGEDQHQTLQPAWSPDGLLTFYDKTSMAFIFLDPRSGDRFEFPNQTGQPGDWHPNGQEYVASEIFFVNMNPTGTLTATSQLAASHLILFNRQDGNVQDLSQADDLEDTSPAFSPRGTFLAFARKYLDVQRWTPGRQIWLMDFGSRQTDQLTNDPSYNHYSFSWSPSGDHLAYTRFNETMLTEPPEIWIINPLTGARNRLVVGGYNPKWLP